MNKLFLTAMLSIVLVSCGNKVADNNERHATEQCTGHSHEGDNHNHSHAVKVVGIAQEGNADSGKITIAKIHGEGVQTFDYSKSNPDKIAAWIAGDTVTIYLEQHNHGNHSHSSVTKVKIGDYGCSHNDNYHNDNHEGHNHQH